MKDGDSQKQHERLNALQTVFKNAIEGSCGLHIGMSFDICLLALLHYDYFIDIYLLLYCSKLFYSVSGMEVICTCSMFKKK